jgi:hypothetical protein
MLCFPWVALSKALGLKQFSQALELSFVYGGILAELGPRWAGSGTFEGVARPQHF